MSVVEAFASQIREVLGNQVLMIRGGYPSLDWIGGEFVLIVVKEKGIEIREKIFKLISENPGEGLHSLTPLVYSAFEFRENREMKSAFSAWLVAEGAEF